MDFVIVTSCQVFRNEKYRNYILYVCSVYAHGDFRHYIIIIDFRSRHYYGRVAVWVKGCGWVRGGDVDEFLSRLKFYPSEIRRNGIIFPNAADINSCLFRPSRRAHGRCCQTFRRFLLNCSIIFVVGSTRGRLKNKIK